MQFNDIFRFYRLKQGYSQPDLAKKLGVSTSLISAYELGTAKPSYELLEAISDVFQVPVDVLMCRTKIYPFEVEDIDSSVMEVAKTIASNKDLEQVVKTIPVSDKCKNCTTVQFLCELILKYQNESS